MQPPRYLARLGAVLGSTAGAGGAGQVARTCLASTRLGCKAARRRVSFLASLPGDGQGESVLAYLGDSSSCRGQVWRAGYSQRGGEELGCSPRSWWWSSLSSPRCFLVPFAGKVSLRSGRRASPEGTAQPAAMRVGKCIAGCPPARYERCSEVVLNRLCTALLSCQKWSWTWTGGVGGDPA